MLIVMSCEPVFLNDRIISYGIRFFSSGINVV
jgi:hypothetical protein